ncbi:hypothetical protein DFAR_3360026 [Desulfarculales bacterium]
MALDETTSKRGHNYVTVFIDIPAMVKAVRRKLPRRQRHRGLTP